MNGSSCGEEKRSESGFFCSVLERGNAFGGLHGERRMGLGRWGIDVLRGMWLTSCAPLACITLIEWRTSVDAVNVEMMRKAARRDWREEECTDATLAVALVDAEHRNVSPEVTFAMGRLLADYDSDGMGFTLRICLWERIVRVHCE
jgi:hypothetical protein